MIGLAAEVAVDYVVATFQVYIINKKAFLLVVHKMYFLWITAWWFGAHLCNVLQQTIGIPLALAKTRQASDGINEAASCSGILSTLSSSPILCLQRSACLSELAAALSPGPIFESDNEQRIGV